MSSCGKNRICGSNGVGSKRRGSGGEWEMGSMGAVEDFKGVGGSYVVSRDFFVNDGFVMNILSITAKSSSLRPGC